MFRNQNKIRSLLVALMVAVSGMAIAPRASLAQNGQAALPKGMTRLTSVEGITEYRLENGLHVLLFPDQSKQTMTVNVTYEVGSKYESYGETGMAHLLEHML